MHHITSITLDKTVARAAPAISILGIPNNPKIKTAFKTRFTATLVELMILDFPAFAYVFTDRLKGHSFGKALLDFDSVVECHVFVFHCLSLHFSD